MLQKSTRVSESFGAIVAALVKRNVAGAWLVVTSGGTSLGWGELDGSLIVNDLNHLDGITFGFFRKRKVQWKLVRFEARNLSCRVKEGPLKEDDTLEVFLFLVGHVLEQAVPKTEIKQELATVTALDLCVVIVRHGHGVHEELKVVANIGLHDVGKAGLHAGHVGTSSSSPSAAATATAASVVTRNRKELVRVKSKEETS